MCIFCFSTLSVAGIRPWLGCSCPKNWKWNILYPYLRTSATTSIQRLPPSSVTLQLPKPLDYTTFMAISILPFARQVSSKM